MYWENLYLLLLQMNCRCRGFAGTLILGAQAIEIGARFLASVETAATPDWKNIIISAASEDSIKV